MDGEINTMTQQLERRNGRIPNAIWQDIVQRWHSNKMIDRFFDFRNISEIENLPLKTRYMIGNVMWFMAHAYNNVYSFDHMETYFYKNMGEKFCRERPKDLDKHTPINGYDKLHTLTAWCDISKTEALDIMDYLESSQFLLLLKHLEEIKYDK
jgi:hypothetical protein